MVDNLSKAFKEAAAQYAHQVAIQWKKGNKWVNLTYKDLKNKVESLSSFLLEQGIKKDDKVAILLDNRPEWPIVFFATVSIGAISIPVNPEATEREAENILADSGSKIAFVNENSFLLAKGKVKAISVDSDEFKRVIG